MHQTLLQPLMRLSDFVVHNTIIKIDSLPVEVLNGQSLIDVLEGCNVTFSCGGKKICGKCKITAKTSQPLSDQEKKLLSTAELTAGVRLACFLQPTSDLELFPNAALAPHIQLYDGKESILNVVKPVAEGELGIAVDIGTTTIAMYLLDLKSGALLGTIGAINCQKQYGDDVISRIQFTIDNPDGTKRLRNMLVNQLNSLINQLVEDTSKISCAVIAANTIITHFFLGYEAKSIAFAPFTPLFTDLLQTDAQTLGLCLTDTAKVVVAPAISGYVGGDIVSGVIEAKMYDAEEISLLIDVGTNGEIVLGNKKRLICCSVAAGPAFEGSHIKCGMGGVAGAIDHFKIENGAESFTVIGNSDPIGICGSGLLDMVAELLRHGRIDETGYFEDEVLTLTDKVYMNQQDIRELQLAKAAIRAGINTLLHYYGIAESEVKKVYLAGGFGSYLNISSATEIGMLPKSLEQRVVTIGNSSGKGCMSTLLDCENLENMKKIVQQVEYIELSRDGFFQGEYVDMMMFE